MLRDASQRTWAVEAPAHACCDAPQHEGDGAGRIWRNEPKCHFAIRSSPRGAPRDSKSAFTRVCDALCVAGTPLRGPRGRGSGLGVPGLASLARDTKSWIPAFAGMSGRAESTRDLL